MHPCPARLLPPILALLTALAAAPALAETPKTGWHVQPPMSPEAWEELYARDPGGANECWPDCPGNTLARYHGDAALTLICTDTGDVSMIGLLGSGGESVSGTVTVTIDETGSFDLPYTYSEFSGEEVLDRVPAWPGAPDTTAVYDALLTAMATGNEARFAFDGRPGATVPLTGFAEAARRALADCPEVTLP